MKRTPIPPITKEQVKRKRRLAKLVKYLIEDRAFGHCEICGMSPDFRGLGGAHIEKRDRKGLNDTIWNIIISCCRCHDHSKYKYGLKISQEDAKEIVKKRNELYNIQEV